MREAIATPPASGLNPIFRQGVGNTIPNAPLILGISTQQLVPPLVVGGIPINIDILNPANGFTISNPAVTWTGAGAGQGVATFPFAFPPGITGAFHFQWWAADALAPGGLAASKGITLQVF